MCDLALNGNPNGKPQAFVEKSATQATAAFSDFGK
jgi:hypothetical protein